MTWTAAYAAEIVSTVVAGLAPVLAAEAATPRLVLEPSPVPTGPIRPSAVPSARSAPSAPPDAFDLSQSELEPVGQHASAGPGRLRRTAQVADARDTEVAESGPTVDIA